jgi:hypothetical protein
MWASSFAANQGWTTGGASRSPAISGNGRYVAMVLYSDVEITDLNRRTDIYEYDLATRAWAHISRDDVTGPGNGASGSPSLSADGTYAAFQSLATNFYPDTNKVQDTFAHKWIGAPITAGLASGSSAPAGTAEEQPTPRVCGLGKPETALPGEPAPDPSAAARQARPPSLRLSDCSAKSCPSRLQRRR